VASLIEPGDHGSTFAANAAICAVARVVLATINTPEFLAGIREKGDYLGEALSSLLARHGDRVSEIRGRGLMWGVETTLNTGDVLTAGYEEGILLGSSGEHVIRLLPPYIVEKTEIDEAVDKLDRILARGAT
jgi:acetylornithine/N-succinyldiaminopimelate aminotransferase